MAEGGHLVGYKACTEGLFLDTLKPQDVALGGVGELDGSSISKEGT